MKLNSPYVPAPLAAIAFGVLLGFTIVGAAVIALSIALR